MRDYAKIGPKFWIGDTGKRLKKSGAEATVVALYLMTSPHSNMLGLFYQPELLIAHETGLGFEGASKGLLRCIESGFCAYDHDSETVWVFEMAKYQIAESLSASDKRSIGVQNEYNALPENPYLAGFFDKYAKAFNLTKKREMKPFQPSPSEGASEPHRSQEQEQEQEQENKNTPRIRAPRFDAQAHLVSLGIEPQIASDWLKTRKAKKLASTVTAFDDFSAEVAKSGMSANGVAKICCTKGWGGFKATWLTDGDHHAGMNGSSVAGEYANLTRGAL